MSVRSIAYAAAMILVVGNPPAVEAQESRAELIETARSTFDVDARMELLNRAADPGMAPLDSLWAVSVYEIAAELIEQNEADLASIWLRWGARHGTWPIDRDWYAPGVVRAYDESVPSGLTAQAGDDPQASTSWRWPGDLDPDASGVIEAGSADPSVPVSVAVEGEGDVAPGGALSLEPGTYELVAFAEGYDTARVTREVLPGATTVLRFDLAPRLPTGVESGVANSLVRIRFTRGGEQVCSNGLIARPDGLILTAYGPLRGAGALEVLRGADVYDGVTVAASNAARDLAVLRLGARGLPTLPAASDPAGDAYVWSVHHTGCGPATSARSRLSAWPTPATEAAPLAASLPTDALGAPVIDRQGGLLGVAVGPDRVAPMSLAQELLQEAVADLAAPEEETQVGGGGGFPVKWVGAGAAVVGVAALLLGGGGGGDDGPPPPTTGGIVVTFPGGAP